MRYRDAKRGTENWSSQNEVRTLYALLVSRTPARPEKVTPATEKCRCPGGSALGRHSREEATAEFCCVLGFAGMPALPALLGRGNHLAGPSGFWVGHSSECFTVELMSDREPGLRARLPGIHSAGAEAGADERVPWGQCANALPVRTGRLLLSRRCCLNPAVLPDRASLSCPSVRRCP
jgi:hypothetical protein